MLPVKQDKMQDRSEVGIEDSWCFRLAIQHDRAADLVDLSGTGRWRMADGERGQANARV